MKFLRSLERLIRPFAIPNLTMLLVFCQAGTFLLSMADQEHRLFDMFSLDAGKVLEGEVWRLITFMILPPDTNPIFAFFVLYLFYLMGTSLELEWGIVRYNLYIFISWFATVLVSFLQLGPVGTNAFIDLSVFLAFAYLFPDFVLMLMFILPVKVKWLALIAWVGMGWNFVAGDWRAQWYIFASVANFFVFFSGDILRRIRSGRRRMQTQARALADRNKPFHRCAVCGVTEKTNPRMDFRVCLQCDGGLEYCEVHLRDHEHVGAPQQNKAP